MRYGRRAARKPSGPTGATSQEEKTKAGMTFPPLREKQLCVCTNFLHFSMPLQLSHCAKMPVLLQDSRNPFLVFHAFKTISQWIMKKTLFPFQVRRWLLCLFLALKPKPPSNSKPVNRQLGPEGAPHCARCRTAMFAGTNKGSWMFVEF